MLAKNTLAVLVLSVSTMLEASVSYGGKSSEFANDLKGAPAGFCDSIKDLNYSIDDKFPQLKSCFSSFSLYLSDKDTICGKCKDVTIKASKYIVDQCNIKKPPNDIQIADHHYYTYYQWKDEEGVNLVCQKSNDDPYSSSSGTCSDEISEAYVIIANTRAKSNDDSWVITQKDKAKVCKKCVKQIYDKYHKEPNSIPSAYLTSIVDPKDFFEDIGMLCYSY
ncbi:hypothetical protein K502DRAFT_156993 [Neoconidiobolus thromboides FSU 785]|nr:hypothetical protein K502DRAFT_156993 [Neoconidiobolus thromboides FSU 785]